MDLEEQILAEHSKENTRYVADFIGNDQEKFDQLMRLFFSGQYRLSQRTAWIMSACVEKYPVLIHPHLRKLISYIPGTGNHPAVRRNSLRLLQFVEIPAGLRGPLISICFDLLVDKKEAIAVKVFAMSVLFNLIENEPELCRELKIIIEDQMPYASAGYRSRGSKILKKLKY